MVSEKSNNCRSVAKIISKKKITDAYILHSAAKDAEVATALSTNEILCSDVDTYFKSPTTLKGHKNSITRIQFSKKTKNVLFSCSVDGKVHTWDTRTGNDPVQSFYDDSDGDLKPLNCFDLNLDENLLCAGTEQIRQDSFLIYWDRRMNKNLGGYWNSHTDEITHVQFNLNINTSLASSSVDGLINIFDLNEEEEEDALINTLNTETSVVKFAWDQNDHISLITGTEDYQFWSTEKTSPSFCTSRDKFSENYPVMYNKYLIDTFLCNQDHYLATGIYEFNKPNSYEHDVQLYRQKKNELELFTTLNDGHTDFVRTISKLMNRKYVTGGEDGQLCLWNIS
ncbi:WD repeat-containing protein 89 [Caerostris darwini]|uniref:WD repeat-containing protein 89 n=1 Tax=Caerostris darwini TaxID=1538125 RepID=A0AAV4UXU6_9ARAC|nr:WD repeat-containing protein 89 [Caerostris darwini]